MAKLSDIFPDENGKATLEQQVETLERRVSLLEELVRQLYQSGDQKPFIAPVSEPQKRPRRRNQ